VAQVQTRLRELGYYDAGAVDGQLVPKGRTEAAILAFRHEHDLPLKPGIDDELLAAMARAEPRQVAEVRASATTQDLREQGVQTIAITDQIKGWAGKLFGGSSVLGGGGLLAWITDKAGAVSGAKDAVGGLGIPPQAIVWLLAAVAGAGRHVRRPRRADLDHRAQDRDQAPRRLPHGQEHMSGASSH
jgi:peptidoglycan hydrolase-like protein with peptidoglycan-binding domain